MNMNRDLLNRGNPDYLEKKEKLVSDLQSVVSDSEEGLWHDADSSGETLAAAREKFRGRVEDVREQLAQMGKAARGRAAYTADTVGEYAREHPWKMVGAIAATGLVVGLLMNRRHY